MYSAVQDKSANYTVVAGDAGDLIRVTTTSGAVTITLPTISTVSDGFKVAIVKWTGDANAVTVARSSTNTINGATSVTIGSQYSSTIFVADFETDQWFAASSGLGTSNVSVDAFSGDNSTVAFTLSSDPGSENNTQVYVSGVYQEKDTYSVSGTTLTFSTAPPTGTSNIEVVFSAPLAIGTPSDGTVTTAKLASTTGSGAVVLATSPTLVTPTLGAASATSITVAAGAVGTPSITTTGDTNTGIFFPAADTIAFSEGGAEAMRIDSSGNVLVAKTATDLTVAGVEVLPAGRLYLTASASDLMILNRLTNDGALVEFRQANTVEGTISVSGTTVSYNGGHLSRWAQTTAPKDDTLVKGTVLSNLDAMNVYTDAEGNSVPNEQLNKVKVSDVEGDINVAGVFVNWSYDEQHSIDEINMAMTGDMIIRIAQGVTVVRGDLLMSAGDGTAKPQGDDIRRSKTVAKVTSTHVTCTYADGSYCVPCVLMAC
jgi:hypothetical protein